MNQTDSLATQYTAGIDLHKNEYTIHIMDTAGNKVYRKRVTKDKRNQLMEIVEPYKGKITLGVESTYNWYWVYDVLEDNGYPCKLGHALYISRQKIGKNKNDKIDAADMSDLLRVNRFPQAYADTLPHRSVRDLLRQRLRLVRQRTARQLHSQCVADQYLLNETPMDQAGYDSETIADVDMQITIDCEAQMVLTPIIERLEKYIVERAIVQDKELYKLLLSVRGIGPIIALTLMYEIGDIHRFKNHRQFSSYCRLVIPQYDSAGKRVGSGNAKNGNPYLCWIFNQLVCQSIKGNKVIAAWYGKAKKKHGMKKAWRRLAHRWAVAIYFMIKRRETFSLEKFLGTDTYTKIRAATDADNS